MFFKGYELPLFLVWFVWCTYVTGDVVLTNNGYKGVTVALSPRVIASSLGPDFLQSLVELLNSASQDVFEETDRRAFFEEVTLLVPKSFDAESFINGTDFKVSSKPSFKSAQVLIEPDNGVVFGGNPYTLQYGRCGTPGLRILLPVSNVVGRNGSAMAREWIRLRYGVFTEDFVPNDPLYSEPSPSKQEVLCVSRSYRDVVMGSSDFRGVNLSGESTFKNVKLNLIKEAPLRLVVVWNVGSMTIDDEEKFRATQHALWKFARLEAPDDAKLGIIYYGRQIFNSDGLLQMSTEENRKIFAPVFPESKQGADMTEALTKARDILAESDDPEGGSILLITQENAPAKDVNATRAILSKSNVKLNALILEQQDGDNGIEELCSELGGGKAVFVARAEEAVAITLQNNAIASLVLSGTSGEGLYFTTTIKTVRADSMSSDEEVTVPIEVDLQSAEMLRVAVITKNSDRTARFVSSLKLTSSGNVAEFTVRSPEYFSEDIYHQCEFRIPKPAFGRWTLSMKKAPTMSSPIIVEVKIKPGRNEDVPITLDTWLSSSFAEVDPSEPLVLYAELRKGSQPIRFATVKARVTVPDGTKVEVELVDNGAGDPDITAGDGIYSRYFTGFSVKGRYSLSVVAGDTEQTIIVGGGQSENNAESRCCGSEFPTSGSRPSGKFSRSVEHGSFFAIRQKPPGDIYPPSRITDLKVVNVDSGDKMRVSLRWTAPGNDFDQGTAKGYDIRSFNRAVNFAEEFDTAGTRIDPFNIDGLAGSPKSSGEIEEAAVFNFQCSRGPTSCFFAVRAYDEVTSGPVSNVVQVTFSELPSSSSESSLNPHTDGSGSVVTDDNDRNYARGGLTSWQLGLAIGLPLLIFIVLLLLLVMCVYFRRRGHDDSKESSPPPPTRSRPIISAPMRAKESTPKEAQDENKNHYAVSVLSGSTISPVNSYSADYLMDKYEQEKKQKQNGTRTPTAPSRSDVASSDGDTSMDTAVGEQNWWTPRARNSQEMGLPLNPAYLDRARPANKPGTVTSEDVPPPIPRRKHTFV